MTLSNGDEVIAPAPEWGLQIRCEKGTNLSYGPWADRQREQLFKFFFPQDYQKMEVSIIFSVFNLYPHPLIMKKLVSIKVLFFLRILENN